jgi:dTDP-4-dehydrorhamnose reductase
MGKYFVIGASGLIGSELLSLLKTKSEQAIGTYTNNFENGLLKFDMGDPQFSDLGEVKKGDIFYILSAYSNPSWIAQNKEEAKKLNYDNTIQLIDFLIEKEAKIIFMSSVEVFDGKKGNYCEDDTPNPLNYYGELKLKVEHYLQENYEDFIIARTGWNVGINYKSRCVIQLTYETLLNEEAKMASDNFFSLCHTVDTALGLYKSSKKNNLKKIHIASEKIINRLTMANTIKQNSARGDNMFFKECKFSEIPYSEPRGRINDLNCKLSRDQLNMKYFDSDDLILKKVKYLDQSLNLNK